MANGTIKQSIRIDREKPEMRSGHHRPDRIFSKLVALVLVLTMTVSILSGCFWLEKPDSDGKPKRTEQVTDRPDRLTEGAITTESSNTLEPTAYHQNLAYLNQQGFRLPRLDPEQALTIGQLLSLLSATYEFVGGEIDLSMINPNLEESESVSKMRFLEVYFTEYFYDSKTTDPALYFQTQLWLLGLYNAIQMRLYQRADDTARVSDLLDRINISTALFTWSQDDLAPEMYSVFDLLGSEIAADAPLDRLTVARMLVRAYEPLCGEIPLIDFNNPTDTNDPDALKASYYFLWLESDNFEPDRTGFRDDSMFLGETSFADQLRVTLQPEEGPCPYGAVVSAIAALIRSIEGVPQNTAEDVIVLNERPYLWHVYQLDTGEYGYTNCMPACVEMALRYQNVPVIPSAESLRAEYPLDGQGWTEYIAQLFMDEYGLRYTDSYDLKLESMLQMLDQGNIVYVMYREENSDEGHAVILKGYWQQGNRIRFIVSDPMHDWIGPFGYPEVTRDAATMLDDIDRHVPRHFIIPPVA